MKVGLPSMPGVPGIPAVWGRIDAAIDAVISLERTLRSLPDDIRLLQLELASVGAMHLEMRGMRSDIGSVVTEVAALRAEIALLPPDVGHLRSAVDGMFGEVTSLGERVVRMDGALGGVERMASRIAHPLRPRRAAANAAGERDAERESE